MKKTKDSFCFIDLFCGIGGFHQALASLGGTCVFASDIDEECRRVYLDNYGLEPVGDITKVDEREIPPHDVLCAGFPCQAFSKAGKRLGIDDPRGTLFYDIVRIAEYHKPAYLLLENVRNLAGHDGGNTWRVIRNNLCKIGYSVPDQPIIFSPHYLGIPQHRERVFILCVRKDLGESPNFIFDEKSIKPSDAYSILETDNNLSTFEDYKLSSDQVELIELWNEFIQGVKKPLPGFPVWTEWMRDLKTSDKLSQYPEWKQVFIRKNSQLYTDNKAFVDGWLAKAKKHLLFTGAKAKLEWQAGKPEKPDLWNTIMQFRPSGIRAKQPTYYPALVAITQTSIVGKKKRYLTTRECANMQGFPQSMKLHLKAPIAYKQLGNSVNVDVVRMFAELLLKGKA
ncbi:MAG: DNA cytosine methyltransferase [Prevotellaceae bacterium]|nr:DNA cytosine methyltransferase [Prevotellaceae bacterium]